MPQPAGRGRPERRRCNGGRPASAYLGDVSPHHQVQLTPEKRETASRGPKLWIRPDLAGAPPPRGRSARYTGNDAGKPKLLDLDYVGASPLPSPTSNVGGDGLGSGRQHARSLSLLFTPREMERGKSRKAIYLASVATANEEKHHFKIFFCVCIIFYERARGSFSTKERHV
jgi:hypothetical protein